MYVLSLLHCIIIAGGINLANAAAHGAAQKLPPPALVAAGLPVAASGGPASKDQLPAAAVLSSKLIRELPAPASGGPAPAGVVPLCCCTAASSACSLWITAACCATLSSRPFTRCISVCWFKDKRWTCALRASSSEVWGVALGLAAAATFQRSSTSLLELVRECEGVELKGVLAGDASELRGCRLASTCCAAAAPGLFELVANAEACAVEDAAC
mmetsp:Transcript_169/g.299  ORF Transcript_169/g.299 Transcript_169/m.299 type:complete len:214 (-) Transcript_169:1430-2071(-)